MNASVYEKWIDNSSAHLWVACGRRGYAEGLTCTHALFTWR